MPSQHSVTDDGAAPVLSRRPDLRFEWCGHLDVFNCTETTLHLAGWSLLLHEKPCRLPQRIVILRGNALLATIEPKDFTIARPDVIEAVKAPRELQTCGFDIHVPVDGPIAYEEVGIFAADASGHVWELSHRPKQEATLQLELTGRCNLRCPKCPSVAYSSFHKQELRPEDVRLAEPVMLRATTFCLDGFGECLLAKSFDDIVEAIPFHKRVLFHTNGMLLHRKTETILDNAPPILQVIVSLDSLDPDQYAVVRKGGHLGKVLHNMRSFIARRRERGQSNPLLIPNLTLSIENYRQLPAFIDLAAELDHIVEITWLYNSATISEKYSGGDFDYQHVLPVSRREEVVAAYDSALAYAGTRCVTIQHAGSFMQGDPVASGTDNDTMYRSARLQECPHLGSACLQADGKGMLCVWQTQPMFNWRAEGTMDPLATERGRQVVAMIRNGIIPAECSGADCIYVGRKLSQESHARPAGLEHGGWQV